MNLRPLVFTAALALVAPASLVAHHSFSAEFDAGKPTKWSGTVTKVEWLNPHTHFYVDVKDDAGKVINWSFELASPNQLVRRGWTRNSLKVGDTVTVDGFPAKDGYPLASARTVMMSDGRKVFVGSTTDGSPQ